MVGDFSPERFGTEPKWEIPDQGEMRDDGNKK